MKRIIYKLFILVGMLFFVNTSSIDAKEIVISCEYDISFQYGADTEGTKIIYNLYDNNDVDLGFKKNDKIIPSFDIYWQHASGFSSSFADEAVPSSGVYKCPDISFSLDMGYATVYPYYLASDTYNYYYNFSGKELNNTSPEKDNKSCKFSVHSDRLDVDIDIELIITDKGNKYFAVDGFRGKVDTSITDDRWASYVQVTTGRYNTVYTYAIEGNEVSNIFKQNFQQLEHNQFTCPTNLYILEESFTDRRYTITTQKPDDRDYHDEFEETPDEDENKEPDIPYRTGCGIIGSELSEKLKWFLDIVKYGGVLLAISLGMLDFAKAVFADEADANKKAGQKFIKRIIAAALIFIVPLILQMLLNIVEIDGVDQDSPFCIQLDN